VMGDDAAGLLPAMLQGVKTKRDKVRGIGDADDTENAALFPELVVVAFGTGGIKIERMGGGHLSGQSWQLRIR